MRLKELTAAILVGKVGEAPDVAYANGKSDAGEQELPAGTPVAALRHRGQRRPSDGSVYTAVQHRFATSHDVSRETPRWAIAQAMAFSLPQ